MASTKEIKIPPSLTVRQLAELFGVDGVEVIKQLMRNGIMANLNQTVDYETAAIIAVDFGYQVVESQPLSISNSRATKTGVLQPCPPVITMMGHIDHGKTTLLDAIRQTNVIATEAGGITQHIGAYQVEVDGKKITFLDTPGHEAFTAMRARGAQVTDIAVLVVAADDGVMPQTIEAVSHARAAGVPIVVAINKIDKPTANLETVKRQLAEQGLLIEEWGGQTICSPISAKKREGISELLENLLIAAEMLGLKADPDAPPEGVVIEAELDKTRGPTATILVHNGTLKVADILVVGSTWGKVKAMFNDKGKRIRQAGPATPVKILGLNDVPRAGDTITSVANEKEAKILVQNRLQNQKKGKLAKPLSLDELFEQIRQGKAKELNIVLKTDVQGSIEPIKNSLEKLSRDDIKVKVIHSGTGELSEGDVMLALASKGVVIGFNTKPTLGAQKLGEMEKVDIRCYQVIYQIIDDIERALKGMKEPSWVEVLEGQAEIRAIFPSDKYGRVAGAYIKQGKASQGASVKIKRRGELITQTTLTSLKRFKEDVKEAATGFECGIGLKEFNQFEVGDIIEFYRKEKE